MKFPPSLQWTIPLMLLGFGLAFILADFFALLDSDLERARASVGSLAITQANRLAALAAHPEQLAGELGYMEEDSEMKYALVCNAALQIIESSPRGWRDRAVAGTAAVDALDLVSAARAKNEPQKKIIANRDLLIAVSPVAATASDAAPFFAVVARDLSIPLGGARENARSDALISAGILSGFCAFLGVFLQLTLGRRVRKVIAAARQISEKNAPPPPLEGGDEFAHISRALHEAHVHIRTQAQNIALQEERYRRMVETLPAMVFVNRGDRIEFMNSEGLKMLGATSLAEVIGKSPFNIIHPDCHARVMEHIRQLTASHGDAQPAQEKILRFDGITMDVEVAASAFVDNQGPAHQIIMWDISERKASEAQREALSRDLQEKNHELEAVVYVASHDLRSPLVNVMGFSRQLSAACREMEKIMQGSNDSAGNGEMGKLLKTTVPRALRFIEQGVTKMDSLLSGFLRFSRLGRSTTEMQPLDMNLLMKSIVDSMTFQIQQAGAEVRIGDLPPCVGDATEINQVFTNLMDNAIKYRHPDRTCIISVQGRTENDKVIYSIADNGIGIAADHVEKVFEIFHRLNPSVSAGEGLGLTIAQRIVKRHHGSIALTSTPGEGSTFTVTLPAVQEKG